MIQENLKKIPFSEGPQAEEIKKEIRGLTVEKLHKIKDHKRMKNICDIVINAVEMNFLVSVNEGNLESRKLKNDRNKPITYTEYEIHMNGANIRSDWASKNGGLSSLPYGCIFRKRELILGIIYKAESNAGYRTFIDKGIANNPHGSSLLISEMKKRIEKLMQKNMKSHE